MSMTWSDRVPEAQPRWKPFLKILLVFVLLYFFLGGMQAMGHGLKALGENPDFDKSQPAGEANLPYRDMVYDIFRHADNPLVGLFVGVLATSIFQSSSFTTSFAVALVVTTPLSLHQAIFIIMGANIGTSVTNVGVSFTHIRRSEEFERAYGSAIVHDFFNTLTVLVLCPVEWAVWRLTGRGLLERLASTMSQAFYTGAPTGQKPTNILKDAVQPLVEALEWGLTDGLGLERVTANIVLTVLGVAILFAALILITKALRSLVLHRVEQFFDKVLFRNAATAYIVGFGLTFVVQSSSITTSLAVPLVGAGLLTIRQVFPYTLGANLGTTFTALIASFATSADTPDQARVGVALAFSHMLFNIIGAGVWYPGRWVPIGLATWWARVASKSKRYAVIHIIVFFFILPVSVILVEWLRR
ncbi:MAG: Na/Pi symporter [Planctomycetes bacterium]|nr:Na/Pi symporter [Planctomycetota bacterium]